MKKTLIMLGFCTALYACGSNSEQVNAARQPEVDAAVNNLGTDRNEGSEPAGSSARGAQLISASDCVSCHKETEKLVGPSYKQIAEKYEATEANAIYLAGKIVEGGSGVWGEIPMAPHKTISKSDAIEMANYILSLK